MQFDIYAIYQSYLFRKKNTFVFTTLHQLDFYSHQMWSGKALPKICFVENRQKKKRKEKLCDFWIFLDLANLKA